MDAKLLMMGLLAVAGTGLFLYSQNGSSSVGAAQSAVAFATFKVRFNKSYGSLDEAAYRLRVFSERVAKIEAHNADPSQTYTLGVNQFSDLTWEELKAFYLTDFSGFRGDAKCEESTGEFDELSAPRNVDWVKKKKVQAVKNQGHCGSCWAFSAVGALESIYAIKKSELPSLSEQELVDCSTSYGNEGCNGGLMHLSFDYVLDHHINTEADYPYAGRDQTCKDISGKGKYGLKGCVQLKSDVKDIVASLVKQPVSVAFYVQDDFFSYKSGIYNPSDCDDSPNHAVLAVGYSLNKDPKKTFFYVKNSWGTSWGDQGFFKIAIGTGKGTCNIAGTEWNYYPTL